MGSSEYSDSVGVRNWAIGMSWVLDIVVCSKWLFWYVVAVGVLGVIKYSIFVDSWAIIVSCILSTVLCIN